MKIRPGNIRRNMTPANDQASEDSGSQTSQTAVRLVEFLSSAMPTSNDPMMVMLSAILGRVQKSLAGLPEEQIQAVLLQLSYALYCIGTDQDPAISITFGPGEIPESVSSWRDRLGQIDSLGTADSPISRALPEVADSGPGLEAEI